MKKFIIAGLSLIFLSGCGFDDKAALVKNGMYRYVSAPYKMYNDRELKECFSDRIVKDVKQLYMPIYYNGEETSEMICFEESETPYIEITNVEKSGENSYIVKIHFGQSENIYDVVVSDGKISHIEKRLIF